MRYLSWQSSSITNSLLLKMGKPPKKRNLSDKVRKAKTTKEIKNNPFEVKINRKKFDVLGRKTKHDVGLPGVSRSKAITKVRGSLDDVRLLTEEFVLQLGCIVN